MPWSAFNKYPGLSPRWASLTETGHTRWCIAFLKEGACLLNPPTGREKTQEACIWMSPNCLMCLFPLLILLCTREHHWFWVPRELLVISQTWESSWDSRPKAQKPEQTKHTKSKTKNSKQNTSEEKRQKNSKSEPYFSGLSGNLIRNSWFLYDLFSNVRIIFFTELSSNGSSWCKETTISVQRDCFLFTNHYFLSVAFTMPPATHLSGLSVQYTHTPFHPPLEWGLRVYIMCYLVSLLCVSHI